MKERPVSLTIIAWILIVMGAISLLMTTVMIFVDNPQARELMSESPIPIPVQHVLSYVGLLITIGSAIAMLNGHKIGRTLYLVWGIVGFIISFATSPVKLMLILSALIFVLIIFFLFRPSVNAYFSPADADNDA